jgi:probable DNA metabolism protein
MIEAPAARWDGSLESLFAVLDEACRTGTVPRRLYQPGPPERGADFAGKDPPSGAVRSLQPELFAAPETPAVLGRGQGSGGLPFPAPECSPPVFPDLRSSPSASLLRELSANAFDAVILAWMSEVPIAAEIIRFAWTVIAAAEEAVSRAGPPAQNPGWAALPEARQGAEQAAANRGDPETCAVLEAAYRAGREIDRLRGLLRFSPCPRRGVPGGDGLTPGIVYIARCSPDHHVLPGLADHFTRRFGDCPWAVIDERRSLALAGEPGTEARIFPLNSGPAGVFASGLPATGDPGDFFEDLWRNYHHSINNPDRNNPALQRQFMPRRYWKYLPELQGK